MSINSMSNTSTALPGTSSATHTTHTPTALATQVSLPQHHRCSCLQKKHSGAAFFKWISCFTDCCFWSWFTALLCPWLATSNKPTERSLRAQQPLYTNRFFHFVLYTKKSFPGLQRQNAGCFWGLQIKVRQRISLLSLAAATRRAKSLLDLIYGWSD